MRLLTPRGYIIECNKAGEYVGSWQHLAATDVRDGMSAVGESGRAASRWDTRMLTGATPFVISVTRRERRARLSVDGDAVAWEAVLD